MIALAIRSAYPTIILGSGMSVSNQVRLPNVTEPPATAGCYAGGEIVRTLAAGRPPGGQITLTASQPRFTPAWACPATSGAHPRLRANRHLPSGIMRVGCFKIRGEKYIACNFRKIGI
jgi:hypothetical protein